LGPLGSDVGIALGVVEEEVVENDLIEMAGSFLGDMLHIVAGFGVGVAKGDELAVAAFAGFEPSHVASGRVGDASGHLHSMRVEEALHGFEKRVIGEGAAAIGLDVDLVHFHLRIDVVPGALEVGRIYHALDLAYRDVHGDAELVVCGCGWSGERLDRAGKAKQDKQAYAQGQVGGSLLPDCVSGRKRAAT